MKNLKKIITIILILFTCVSFAACDEVSSFLGTDEVLSPNKSEDLIDEEAREAFVSSGMMEVHFIDVGQGDATFIKIKDKTLLIDGGEAKKSNVIVAYLKKQNITKIDYIINTHPHSDHVGGLSGALSVFEVGKVYSNTLNYDTKAFNDFKEKVSSQNLIINIPGSVTSFDLDAAKITMYNFNLDKKNENNNLIAVSIEYGKESFLIMADAERKFEEELLKVNPNIKANVLRIGHHGAQNATTYPFLRHLMPEYSVISVGKDNSYGHPTSAVLSKLKDAGTKVFRTDIDGDIIFSTDGTNLKVVTNKIN